jgi:uncharacterized protein (DUF885 family)
MTDFDALVRACIDEAFALDPLEATNAGIHLHDHRWPDWTDAGRRERIAFAERWLSTFRRLDATALSSAEAIDRDRMVLELEARRYVDADLREDAWSPLIWIYRVGDGLFTLLSREFAPPAVRLASAAGRMEGLPAVLDAGRDVLGTAPGVPVARFHVEIALRDLPGLTSLVEEALDLAAAHPGDPEVVALRPRLAAAAQAARAAIEAFGRHLDAVVRPASKGEGRLGKARFDAKLAHVYSDPSMTAERILALAEGQYGAVRGEMVRIARAEWRRWKGDTPEPQDDGDAITRRPMPFWMSVGPSSWGSRRSAGIGTSSAWRRSRWSSSGRRCSCAASRARCSTHPARSMPARRRSSPSPRRRPSGRPSGSSRCSGSTTSDSSAC